MRVNSGNSKKITANHTNTTYFINPAFGYRISDLTQYGFIDSFLYDKNREDIEPDGKTIYFLFKPNESQLVKLQNKIEDWENQGILIEDYDYPSGYVVAALRFPNKYKDQYKLFLQGRYSEFSPEYKELIPKKTTVFNATTGKVEEIDSVQYLVVNKRVKLKEYWEEQTGCEFTDDMEYWSKPDIQKETLDIDKLIEESEKRKA